MKVVRINNFSYYSALLGIFIGGVAVVWSLINNLLMPMFIGLVFVIVGMYSFLKYRKYSLELSKGVIKEFSQKKTETVLFKDIKKLDCNVKRGFRSVSVYAVFDLVKQDNSSFKFEVSEEAAICDIAEWVETNYPSATITENVKYFFKDSLRKTAFRSMKS